MATEAAPPTKADKVRKQNRILLARGEKWQKWVDAEDIRLTEATVDENGIRHIEFMKDNNDAYNRSQLRNYEKMGYTIEDKEYYYDVTIPDAVYREKIEKPNQEKGIRQVTRHKEARTTDGLTSSFEDVSETVSSKDLL